MYQSVNQLIYPYTCAPTIRPIEMHVIRNFVIYTSYLLLSLWTLTMSLSCGEVGRDKEFNHNLGGQTCWKIPTFQIKDEMDDNIKVGLGEID